MIIVNQLLQFYLLICMRILQSILVIILKASTPIVKSAIPFVLRMVCMETSPSFYSVDHLNGFYMEWAFTEKFRRPTNRFLLAALNLLWLLLIVDLYFVLFMGLCLSAQECVHLIGSNFNARSGHVTSSLHLHKFLKIYFAKSRNFSTAFVIIRVEH